MREPVTLVRPAVRAGGPVAAGDDSLPSDLLDQVRSRVALLAGLLFVAFAFDPVLALVAALVSSATGSPPPPDSLARTVFLVSSLLAIAASGALWWVARDSRFPSTRLHVVGLVYEVAICGVIATTAIWQEFLDRGAIPRLTWVPVVVLLFPLLLPGPPRRMLIAGIAAGATVPLAILTLALAGQVRAGADDYISASLGSGFAVTFAFIGARVIYGLGREVAAARELGSYLLESRLGHGGMGEVWRARHRLLARPAAIKLIRRRAADGTPIPLTEDVVRRFEREAQAVASLRSPHTVDLFDFGVASDGTLYSVMELLEGLDASALVRRHGPIPPARAIHLLRQVCRSLEEAEARGLVHRDIKPANIFVCRYGVENDFVKVLDFGLVRALSGGSPLDPTRTSDEFIHGTPEYMPPEQALGRADLDGRADLYATGCVAYWFLTGRQVFEAPTPMAHLLHHANTPPAPPSSRASQPIPEALERVVMACLEKDPARRPQTARALSDALGAVPLERAWSEVDARDWWNLHLPASA